MDLPFLSHGKQALSQFVDVGTRKCLQLIRRDNTGRRPVDTGAGWPDRGEELILRPVQRNVEMRWRYDRSAYKVLDPEGAEMSVTPIGRGFKLD